MKKGIIIIMFFAWAIDLSAQVAEPGLNEYQKWVLAKTEAFYKASGVNISRPIALNNFKNLLASNQLCERGYEPDMNIHIEGNRINETSTILKWDVTFEKGNGRYIIERRFNNQHGAFDSLGVIETSNLPAIFQSYRFRDANDFPGITWYRLRRIGGSKEETKLINVKGYSSSLKVIPNPSPTSVVSIQLSKFKLDNQTTLVITDSRGIPVHTRDRAFIGTNIYQLHQLQLPKGVYHIKVTNKFNTSATTFVIQ